MKSTRRHLIPLTLMACGMLTLSAAAQQAAKVGIIDSQRAFQTSAEGKKAAGQLQEKDTKIKNDLAKIDDQIRSLESKMNTQRLTLSQEALIQYQSDIEKKSTERKRYAEDADRDFQQLQINVVQKIRNEMIVVIDQIAKEKAFDLIVDLAASGVVFFNPAIDITDEVVKRYDASKASAPKK